MGELDVKIREQVTALIERAVAQGEVPCANVLVLRGGEEWVYAEGGRDLGPGRPLRRDTIFRLYSQTKPVTAAAVALLVERGVLDVLEPVEKYLPGFAHPRVLTRDGAVPANRSVTLMDLLDMKAGLSYPGDDPAGKYVADLFRENTEQIRQGGGMTTRDLANAIGQLPLAFQPGEEWRYSTCADVLGAVVEAADGRPFARFLQEEFFAPLGMTDTAFWVPEEKQDRFVTCARRTPRGLEPWRDMHLCVGRYDREPAFASGGAGLVSTLDDYARFATMLRNGGVYAGRRFLSAATVRWLTSGDERRSGGHPSWDGYDYSKLMRICVQPSRAGGLATLGEYGWDGWLGTYFMNFPEADLTLLVGINVTDTGTCPLTRRIRNAVLAEAGREA